MGNELLMITPEGRRSIPCPTYREIRLALCQGRKIARELDAFRLDCIHVATEGPLGLATRRYGRRPGYPSPACVTARHSPISASPSG